LMNTSSGQESMLGIKLAGIKSIFYS
jgi:hypothetical protein